MYVIDEDGEIQHEAGLITDDALLTVTNAAELLDLKCLNFVGIAGDTFFNDAQLHQIKRELTVLRKHHGVDLSALDVIEKGVQYALSDVLQYLKFEGE